VVGIVTDFADHCDLFARRVDGWRKTDGRREAFDERKLRTSFERPLQKRPVSAEQIDEAVRNVVVALRTSGERELPSRRIGEYVMQELRKLDQVAYVRFASVYRSFQDVEDFREEIERLQRELPVAQEQLSLLDEPPVAKSRR
jgi:transcriptional repressor NrdR